jgi:hypothetical protein
MFNNAPEFPSLDRAAAYVRAAGFVRAPIGDERLFWQADDYSKAERSKGEKFWENGAAYTGRAVGITDFGGKSFFINFMEAL